MDSSITSIVTDALFTMRLSMDDYAWLEQVAIHWVKFELKLSASPSVEYERFNLANGSRIWQMPSDYVRLGKIGFKKGQYFYTLTRRDSLYFDGDNYGCDFDAIPQGEVFGTYFGSYFWGGQFYPPQFSVGGGFNVAYYKIDDDNRQIIFSLETKVLPDGIVVIQYLSNGKNVNGNTFIHPAYAMPLKNYLIWQYGKHGDKPTSHALNNWLLDLERQYLESMYNHRADLCPTTDEIMDAIWESRKLNLS